MAKKKSSVEKIGGGIKDAAAAVAKVADVYVMQPVGLIEGNKKKPKSKSTRKAERKGAVTAKMHAVKKGAKTSARTVRKK